MEFISNILAPPAPEKVDNPPENTIIIDTTKNTSWFGVSGGIDEKCYHQFVKDYNRLREANPLTVEITTKGGDLTYSVLIANILSKHPHQVICRIPLYAMSGGSLIALACSQIEMADHAVLGPFDPQLNSFVGGPVRHLKQATQSHFGQRIPSEPSFADMFSRFMSGYTGELEDSYRVKIGKILGRHYTDRKLTVLFELFYDKYAHCIPITPDELPDFLPVKIYIPEVEVEVEEEDIIKRIPTVVTTTRSDQSEIKANSNDMHQMLAEVRNNPEMQAMMREMASDPEIQASIQKAYQASQTNQEIESSLITERNSSNQTEELDSNSSDWADELGYQPINQNTAEILDNLYPQKVSWGKTLVKEQLQESDLTFLSELQSSYEKGDIHEFTEFVVRYDQERNGLSPDLTALLLRLKQSIKSTNNN